MTKKFFKDWSERRSLTESIELKKGLQYEKNDRVFHIYGNMLKISTLDFDEDCITILAKSHYFSKKSSDCGIMMIPVKIHRKDIMSVKFKKL